MVHRSSIPVPFLPRKGLIFLTDYPLLFPRRKHLHRLKLPALGGDGEEFADTVRHDAGVFAHAQADLQDSGKALLLLLGVDDVDDPFGKRQFVHLTCRDS